MLGAVFTELGKLELKDVPIPKIKNRDDVLLKIEVSSICGTDIQILKIPQGHPANKGIILGHEYIGRVVEIGSNVKHIKIGDRVVVDPNITCGVCHYCRKGLPNLCENMITLGIHIDGGFTEFNLAPAKALYKISSNLPAERAIFTEPLSCVLNGMKKIKPKAGETVVVIGAGPIGLYFIQLFKLNGISKIFVIEPNEYKRSELACICGAFEEVINPLKHNPEKIIKEKTDGLGVDIVVDTVGTQLHTAINYIQRGGRILLFGMNSTSCSEIYQNTITRYEYQIIGSFISNFTFPEAINLLENNLLPKLNQLITHKISLKNIHNNHL